MWQKKRILYILLLVFLAPLMNAYADDFLGVTFCSENRVFDKSIFTANNTYSMHASVGVTPLGGTHDVYLQLNGPAASPPYNTLLSYQPEWSSFAGYSNYGMLLLPTGSYNPPSSYPPPGAWYEVQGVYPSSNDVIAHFYIDIEGNGPPEHWGTDPNSDIRARPKNTYFKLPAVSNVKITGGIHPTITWDPVQGADRYRVAIVGLGMSGNPNMADLKFYTMSDLSSLSFRYTGDLFQIYRRPLSEW